MWRRGPGTGVRLELFTPRSSLAEAYAYAGRPTEAARLIDAYVDARRRLPNRSALNVPYALVTAAYVDVMIGRRASAVARLEEAFRLPAGDWIPRPLLRAGPSWAVARPRGLRTLDRQQLSARLSFGTEYADRYTTDIVKPDIDAFIREQLIDAALRVLAARG